MIVGFVLIPRGFFVRWLLWVTHSKLVKSCFSIINYSTCLKAGVAVIGRRDMSSRKGEAIMTRSCPVATIPSLDETPLPRQSSTEIPLYCLDLQILGKCLFRSDSHYTCTIQHLFSTPKNGAQS